MNIVSIGYEYITCKQKGYKYVLLRRKPVYYGRGWLLEPDTETQAALEWVRRKMKERGLTHTQVACHLNVKPNAWKQWIKKGQRLREWYMVLCMNQIKELPTRAEILEIMEEMQDTTGPPEELPGIGPLDQEI